MDDSALYARMHANLREFFRLTARASPGARAAELPGLTASVVPLTPDRSVMNSVVYETAEDLERALPDLGAIYSDAGVRAWTVWVPAQDTRAAGALSAAGHLLDAEPAVMCMELSALEAPRPDDLELDPEPSVAVLADLNDRAYGYDRPDFSLGLAELRGVTVYVACVDGVPASCLGALDHEGDCCITLVATRPEARGRGLAGRLMALALHEARERGCTTTSLQATKMGHPIYAALGYRDLGPIQMWEHRVPN
jgi:GNAT superfamily N-acetyltransferase